MSFFRQGVDATAAGLGTALRTSAVPFRSISGAFAGESEAPNAGSSTSASGSPKPASNSSSRPNASRSTSQARVSVGKDDDDDDDDATLVRSAADSLRLGAKNEEKRRRQVQEQTRAQTQQQQRQHPKATAAPPDRSAGSGGGSFFASAGSFLLPSRKPSPTTSRSASPAPRSSSSTNQKQPPAPSIPPDMNCFDFPADWPDAERSPEGGALPSRRYYVLTQAGKPVFLSHLAKRRLAREDAARTRLRQARETQRERDEKLASLGTSTADEEERKRLTSEGEEARKAEEEARRLESLASDQDEEQSAVQVGVLQALVSNFASHGNETLESKSIEILKLPARSSRVVYLLREPLYLAVTSTWHGAGYLYSDSATTLKAHLEVLYSGIVSLISEAQLHRLFARGHNFDLRRMLEGTDGIVESLVARMQADFGLSLGAGGGGVCLRPMRVDLKLREDLTACLSLERWERRPLGKALAAASAAEGDEATKRSSSPSSSGQSRSSSKPLDPQQLLSQRMPARPKDLIYVLLVTPELELVTLVRPRRLSAYPLDLHLLINTVAGMSRRGQREAGTVNWVPICLPRFAPQGMVQAHISWLGAAPE
ncbi:DUF254-domain-containing protein [Jaminaea rosea]|uniref:Vacuolar fusion protein MON1 n=1 Tax=Jaminaea rosea TaxID=1569628 RepID=A0A316URU6_9BASI|nr:DUF254-domain-containing protein [Jaminaea rosea]PWN28040.1 DUF254-domain-containing protein [Jaminaea rosea]